MIPEAMGNKIYFNRKEGDSMAGVVFFKAVLLHRAESRPTPQRRADAAAAN
jgi:hypothetical protein